MQFYYNINLVILPIMQSQIVEEQQELKREYNREEFVTILTDLLKSINIIAKLDLFQLYDTLLCEKGKVVGNDIIGTVQTIKQQAQQERTLLSEIIYYRKKINQLTQKGITCITILEFQDIFTSQLPEGLITKEITRNSAKLSYISLTKLNKVICSVENIKNKQQLKKGLRISNLQKSNIFEESDFQSLPQINVNLIIKYVNQSVLDAGVRNNLKGMLQQIDKKIYDLLQNDIISKEVENTLRRNQEAIDDELYHSYQKIDQKQLQVDNLKAKVKQLDQEVTLLHHKYQVEIANHLQNIQLQNDKLRRQIAMFGIKNQQLQTKMDWFKANYEGLTKEYQQFIQQVRINEQKNTKQKDQKIFVQRTIKEQLQDALIKINMLRNQNSNLKQKNSDLAYQYENKMANLQLRIKQLEQTNIARGGISKFHYNGSQIRNSSLEFFSQKKLIPTITDSLLDELKNKQTDKSLTESQVMGKSSNSLLNFYLDQNKRKNSFKKNKRIISIQIGSVISDLIDQNNQNNTHESVSFGNQIVQSKEKIQQNPKEDKKRILSSLGYVIISDGNRYPIYIILSQDRISFYDSKMRLNYSIKIEQLRKIIFCYHNITWMVFKLKANQINEKKQSLNDTVVNIMNRADVLQFLHLRCSKKLQQNNVKIEFQKQDRIWVNSSGSQTLISNFRNYYNLYRISTNNAGNMFQVSLKQNSWFNFAGNVILVVSNLGILVFQKDGDFLLQRSQKLLNIIPIVQLMQIQRPADNKLTIKYRTDKKLVYNLKLDSISLTKKLISLIQQFRGLSVKRKSEQVQKFSLFTSVVNRNSKVD